MTSSQSDAEGRADLYERVRAVQAEFAHYRIPGVNEVDLFLAERRMESMAESLSDEDGHELRIAFDRLMDAIREDARA
jgi:hypothetical protein